MDLSNRNHPFKRLLLKLILFIYLHPFYYYSKQIHLSGLSVVRYHLYFLVHRFCEESLYFLDKSNFLFLFLLNFILFHLGLQSHPVLALFLLFKNSIVITIRFIVMKLFYFLEVTLMISNNFLRFCQIYPMKVNLPHS